MKFGIDISGANTIEKWEEIKNTVDFVIIKYGNIYDDEEFYQHETVQERIKACQNLKIPFGLYIYNYCNNVSNLERELNKIYKDIKNINSDLPVFLDMEDESLIKEGQAQITQLCIKYHEFMEAKDIENGIYANASWFKNYIMYNDFDIGKIWVAQYGVDKPQMTRYDIWQYTSSGKLDGIKGNVDLNYANDDLFHVKQEDENIKVFKTGRYIVDTKVLTVRKTPEIPKNDDNWLRFGELSTNAQIQVKKLTKNWGYVPNGLVKGVVCDVSEIQNNCWGKIPSGWINLNYCKKEL